MPMLSYKLNSPNSQKKQRQKRKVGWVGQGGEENRRQNMESLLL